MSATLRLILPTLFMSLFFSVPLVHDEPSQEQKEQIVKDLNRDYEAMAIFDSSQKSNWEKHFVSAKQKALNALSSKDIQLALNELSLPWNEFVCSDKTMKESLNPYVGYSQLMLNDGFNIHLPEDKSQKTILIQWKSFGEHYHEALNSFIRFAKGNKFLGYQIILDLRYAKGDAPSSFLLHKLFGADINHSQLRVNNNEKTKTYFQGLKSMEGQLIAEELRQSDKSFIDISSSIFGIANSSHPTFTGNKVILTGPDQGASAHEMLSIIIDNDLAPTIGMPSESMGYRHLSETKLFEGINFTWPQAQVIRANGKLLHKHKIIAEEAFLFSDAADYEILDRALKLID